jgi:hypothetical protein
MAVVTFVGLFSISTFGTTCVAGKSFKVRQVCGHVRDFAGASIPGAIIQISPKGRADSISKTNTDSSGNFRFEGLPAGEYEMRVKFAGFWDASQNFELARPAAAAECKRPIRVVMKPAGGCSYVENAWKMESR